MADTPITQYQRVPPPSDPASAQSHLDGELQKLERSVRDTIARLSSLSSTYAPLASPVLTGDPQAPTPATADNDTSIATTAFVKAQDYATNTALTSGLSSKADTSALSGYATTTALSTGLAGKADTSALATLAPLASPALTGAPTAPTQASGDNSTKLATTAYADAAAPWKLIRKTSDQTVSATAAFADDTQLQFAVAANTTYSFRATYYVSITSGTGGHKVAVNGPASPSRLRAQTTITGGVVAITAYDTLIAGAGSGVAAYVIVVTGSITTGATAGTFAMRIAQNAASGATVYEKGSTLEYVVTP